MSQPTRAQYRSNHKGQKAPKKTRTEQTPGSYKHYYLLALGLVAGLVLVAAAFFLWLMPQMKQSTERSHLARAANWVDTYTVDLDPQREVLVEDLRQVDIQPENQAPSAQYFTKQELDKRTETSFARRVRQVTDTDANGFAWYWGQQQEEYLYRHGRPYTGWFGQPGSEWTYYKDGRLDQQATIDKETARLRADEATFIQSFVPSYQARFVYLKAKSEPMYYVDRQSIRYSILNRGRDGLLLSNFPGQPNSYFLANTNKYADIPMEVTEEAVVDNQTWLHVAIGYQDLGWIRQDLSYQDYVLTNYSERKLIDTVQQIMREEIDNMGIMAGASFVDNETMAQVDVDNQIFFPASTQKIYVLTELYRQYKEGKLQPSQTMAMEGSNIVPGAGHINESPAGTVYSLDELVDYVAIYSDNTAANMLIEAVGGGGIVTQHAHELGMLDTYLEGKYYQNDNGRFQTTPDNAARLFAKLANHELNGEPWDSMLIDKLRLNSHSFLRTYLYETDSWNKSGLGAPEQNDVATFVTQYGSYSIAVYTNSWSDYDARFDQVGRLSQRVYEAFNQIRSDLWHPYDPEQGFYR